MGVIDSAVRFKISIMKPQNIHQFQVAAVTSSNLVLQAHSFSLKMLLNF